MTTIAIPVDVSTAAVCNLADLPVGEVVTVAAPGHPKISVFHTEDGLFAIDDTCTHQDASLADGWVENCTVECPLHDSCFDLRTGAVTGPPAKVAVRTHAVSVVEGVVVLQLPPLP
ncbi:bifunctional 3-phenylpropionate/cinnamic acid dioxygenase ferredoxin subunit [Antrihabitans cavernicola]|uniref:Bifunctional 3-phenylpropionate/cinnamic acid dioxygenase ferredoxin subunit n=1 Tax=Antrihabitans cavernicola TaxID=2495913 RepID=A0A5A7SAC0_9NOCA|nr:bifunctional 3-phenylpropionate/cinnamic acid dioxygenase ferredoxin subunit [Spelaeibacter cavernicola]KAA0021513.1 bifunctional 3-phenylpropionate/cinnamic acid dioxygenase ferredoxin subunit [Spelaeibacter cavernicola]